MGHDRSDATLAARCPMQHSYKIAAFWRDKIFYSHSKCKMYYRSERLRANVHKDIKCHAFCLSELGNKYRSQENGNEDIIEFRNCKLGARKLRFGSQ